MFNGIVYGLQSSFAFRMLKYLKINSRNSSYCLHFQKYDLLWELLEVKSEYTYEYMNTIEYSIEHIYGCFQSQH